MKKIMFLALLGLMIAGAMTSCSKDEEKEEKKDDTGIIGDITPPKYAASYKLWLIENDALHIRQIWSDAIAIPACNKEDFDGGDYSIHKADCRNNPGYAGYLYSWPYVNTYAADLCPDSWRVPTRTDFMDLDKALGGNGSVRTESSAFINANYIEKWGGSYGGSCSSDGTLYYHGSSGNYWSAQLSSNRYYAYDLYFFRGGIDPSDSYYKSLGFTVRCVK